MDNNRRPNFLIAAEAIILIAVILIVGLKAAGLFGGLPKRFSLSSETTETAADSSADSAQNTSNQDQNNSDTDADQSQQADQDVTSDIAISKTASAKAVAMSTEDKVSQLFYITPEQLTHVGTMVIAGDQTRSQINTHPVGGLAFSQKNFTDADQAKTMLSSLQQMMSDRVQTSAFISYSSADGENVDRDALNSYGVNTIITADADGSSYKITYNGASNTALTGKTPSDVNDAIAIINAGTDMLVFPADFEGDYDGIVSAVQKGTISAETLNQAVGRILTVKGL